MKFLIKIPLKTIFLLTVHPVHIGNLGKMFRLKTTIPACKGLHAGINIKIMYIFGIPEDLLFY